MSNEPIVTTIVDPADLTDQKPLSAPGAAFELPERSEEASPRFLSQTAETPAILSAKRGLAPAYAELLEAIAFDIENRGRRIVLLASRHRPELSARAIGAVLAGGVVEVATTAIGWPDLETALLGPAEAEMPPAAGSGARVLIARQSFRDAAAGIGIAGPMIQEDDPRIAAIETRLETADAYLLVALQFDEDRRKITEALPEVYLLPWLDPWLCDLETSAVDLLRSDFEERFGEGLRSICSGGGREDRARERELFLQLESVARADPSSHENIVKAFADAIKRAEDGKDGWAAAAIETLGRIFADGEIARMLFTVRVHAPEEPWSAVLKIVATLLPDDRGPLCEDLPPPLLALWQDRLADAERFGLPRPPVPSWRAVFRHDPDVHLKQSGLHYAGGRIEPHQSFRLFDPAGMIAERRPGFLESAYRSFSACRPYAAADVPLASLVAFHLSLCETLAILPRIAGRDPAASAEAEGFARTIAAMLPDERDLPGTRADGREDDSRIELARNHGAERVAAVLDAIAREEERRGRGARRLVHALLLTFARILSRPSLMRLLGYFLLAGRPGFDDSIAQADLTIYAALAHSGGRQRQGSGGGPESGDQAEGQPGADDSEESRRQTLLALVSATDDLAARVRYPQGKIAPTVRPWLDGLHGAADERGLEALGVPAAALASFAEDFATQASITAPYLRRRKAPPALAADLFDGPPDTAPGLIIRMLSRDPRRWLEHLEAYERFAAPGAPTGTLLDRVFRLEDAVYWRLRDVTSVLLGGLDDETFDHLADGRTGRATFPFFESVWPAAARSLGLPMIVGIRQAQLCVTTAYQRPPVGHALPYLELMTLYPAALLVDWRLRLLGDDPIEKDSPAYAAHLALMAAIRDGVDAAGRRRHVADAFAALAAAQVRLADLMHNARFDETARHFRRKAAVIAKIQSFMAPRSKAALQTVSGGAPAATGRPFFAR